MNPGRELDKLISEKIFGEKIGEISLNQFAPIKTNVKPYSTDIAAAWTIVDAGYIESVVKIENGTWFARHRRSYYDIVSDRTVVKIGAEPDNYYEIPIYRNDPDTHGAFGDTAPMAICKSALKAVEGK